MNVTILGLGLVAPRPGDAYRVRTIPEFDEPRAKRLPRLEQMALAAARQALLAGPDMKNLALVFGTGYGGLAATRDFLEGMATRGAEYGSPIAFQQSVHHSPAGQVSILLGLQGPSLTLSARELSGESALQAGITLLSTGRAEEVLVLAADELTATLEAGYRAFGSPENPEDGPSPAVLQPGEGAAAVLLAKRPGTLRLERCTLTAHPCPVLRFPSREQLRPLLLEGAQALGGANSVSLAAPRPDVLEAETSVLSEVKPAPALWLDTQTFGFHPSAGLLRIAAAAARVQAAPVGFACAVHGLALGGGQALTVVRHVRA
jgi:Beta-ketoacyl synthase, N-terminal domain